MKKGSGSKTLPNCSPSRQIESPTMSRRLPPDPSEAIGSAIVKYNYQAQQPDELSLTKGTRILILEKSNDGWWRGQSGNAVGWFPSNYTTEDCDNDGEIHTYAMAENVLDIVVSATCNILSLLLIYLILRIKNMQKKYLLYENIFANLNTKKQKNSFQTTIV